MFKLDNMLSKNSNESNDMTSSVLITTLEFAKPKYQLNIKVISGKSSVKEFYEKFNSHHQGDSGIDLVFNDEVSVDSFAVGTIDFGIQCEMINTETNTYASYYLVPRSSIANTNFQLANSIGIIDAGYRGNIKAKVRNFNSQMPITFPKGSYFQIVAPDLQPIKVQLVDVLSDTTRNDGGFGSTNKTNLVL
jgi:dUTP pyrophosphatase